MGKVLQRINNVAFKPPQSSIDNFNLVWEHYGCTREEAKHEKQKILNNFNELDKSYSIIAAEIRGLKS